MSFNNLKTREAVLLGITCILAFAFVNYLVVYPWTLRIKVRSHQLGQVRADISRQMVLISSMESLKNERHKYDQDLQNTSNFETSGMWMKRLSTMAHDTSVTLGNREPQMKKQNNESNLMTVKTPIEGKFESVITFLNTVQADKSRPQIVSCDLQAVKPDEDRLTGNITLLVPVKRPF